MAQFMGVWGFVIAGGLFLVAALLPAVTGEGLNTTFFVLGIVFLILGLVMVRRRRSGSAADEQDRV